jgi:hypothetical protein
MQTLALLRKRVRVCARLLVVLRVLLAHAFLMFEAAQYDAALSMACSFFLVVHTL